MQLEEACKTLTALADDQALQEKALVSCQVSLQHASLADPTFAGVPLEDIQLCFDKCSLVFCHDVLDYPFIDTQIGLYVEEPSGLWFRDLRPIGHYSLITLLNGEVEDDYLIIDAASSSR